MIANALDPSSGTPEPSLQQEAQIVLAHQEKTIELYGEKLGNKTFRKHLGWTLARLHERGLIAAERLNEFRASLLPSPDNAAVRAQLANIYADVAEQKAAA